MWFLPAQTITPAGQQSRAATAARRRTRAATAAGGHPSGTASLGRVAAAEALDRLRQRIKDGGRRYETFYTWLRLRSIADRAGLVRGPLQVLASQLGIDRHTLARHLGDLVAVELLERTGEGLLTLPRPTTSTAALRGRGWVYTAAAALQAATMVLAAADAVVHNRLQGSPRRARAAAGALEALRHLVARHGSGELWRGPQRLRGAEDVAAWLGVDPDTWRAWQTVAVGAGWLTQDGRGWVLRDTDALEGCVATDPAGAFFGAATGLAGANFAAAPFPGSLLQSPLPPTGAPDGQGQTPDDGGEEGGRCAACGAQRRPVADQPARVRRGGVDQTVAATLEALYAHFPAQRACLNGQLWGSLPLRRHLARLADAGASPGWIVGAIGQPLDGLRNPVAGLAARARAALDRWIVEQARAERVASERAARAAERAREREREEARWTTAAAALDRLPAALRSRAEDAIAAGLTPALRTADTIQRRLQVWCMRAVEDEDGRPLADRLTQDLAARDTGPFRVGAAVGGSGGHTSPLQARASAAAAAALAKLPEELRDQARRAAADRLRPEHRKPLHVEACLVAWCMRALEDEDGRPLADRLTQDLAAGVDLTAPAQPAA